MATKKSGSKKQVKRAVKKAVKKQSKTDAVDYTDPVKVQGEQFKARPAKKK